MTTLTEVLTRYPNQHLVVKTQDGIEHMLTPTSDELERLTTKDPENGGKALAKIVLTAMRYQPELREELLDLIVGTSRFRNFIDDAIDSSDRIPDRDTIVDELISELSDKIEAETTISVRSW